MSVCVEKHLRSGTPLTFAPLGPIFTYQQPLLPKSRTSILEYSTITDMREVSGSSDVQKGTFSIRHLTQQGYKDRNRAEWLCSLTIGAVHFGQAADSRLPPCRRALHIDIL